MLNVPEKTTINPTSKQGKSLGILPQELENSAAYIQSWIKVLKNDYKLLFHAAAQAQKAVDFILNIKT